MQTTQKLLLLLTGLGGAVPTLAQSGEGRNPISQPLVSNIYTADPSAHVFGGKIYIYPSHDIETNIREDDEELTYHPDGTIQTIDAYR